METIDLVRVRELLQNNIDNQVSAIQHIGTGWWSHAYAFTVGQQSFILRVSAFEEDFQKDAFAYRRFSSPTLPIPKVIQIGRFDDSHYFAITERCAGRIIAAMDEADIYPIIPELFDIAGEIPRIDVSPFSGWGLTDVHGNGRFESWQQYLLSLYDQKFTFDLHDLAQRTFFELDLYETYLEEMKRLLPYCPSEKYLVHGDYGFDNVVSDGAKITGVLDWADDLLGDFIYDLCLRLSSKEVGGAPLHLEKLRKARMNLRSFSFFHFMRTTCAWFCSETVVATPLTLFNARGLL